MESDPFWVSECHSKIISATPEAEDQEEAHKSGYFPTKPRAARRPDDRQAARRGLGEAQGALARGRRRAQEVGGGLLGAGSPSSPSDRARFLGRGRVHGVRRAPTPMTHPLASPKALPPLTR